MNKPTIGLEIELPWRTMLARVDQEAADILGQYPKLYNMMPADEKQRVELGFDALDTAYRDIVDAEFGDKIERGGDGFAEFAVRPQYEYEELGEVVQGLYDRQVLLDGEIYPLHVTLGGIAAVNNCWLILMAAEISGGTTPERIAQTRTWERKGLCGVLNRQPREMQLGMTSGVEFRTFSLLDMDRLNTVLKIAQTAGGTLMAKLAGDASAKSNMTELYRHLMNVTQEKGIDASKQWQNPTNNHAPWLQMAEALKDEDWRQTVQEGVLNIV